jgi:methylenetetrahydrofolate--tRNA-(uracil-5-)-methyltransferase
MGGMRVAVVGGGLAGCECALRLARAGLAVTLFEQKPERRSVAHVADGLAELVCSNSLRSDQPTTAVGLLKEEMLALGSDFMESAHACRVPAGRALAVDRDAFSAEMTSRVASAPGIAMQVRCVTGLDDPVLEGFDRVVIAAGPLASEDLSRSLAEAAGREHCYFYDAIAPIVWTASLDPEKVFRASRYDTDARKADGDPGEAAPSPDAASGCGDGAGAGDGLPLPEGDGDYINCPMNREEYENFYRELLGARRAEMKSFESLRHFEGCMPIEALADRGPKTLTFGPFKPVGLKDPRTGHRPWAVLQLRPERRNMETCNLVGCQTRLVQSEQERVFRLVPGMEQVEFVRYGSMHRNTYLDAPSVLDGNLALRGRPGVHVTGQLTGVEGYVESAAAGLWLGMILAAADMGVALPRPPRETALGCLLGHLEDGSGPFQPSNVHFGLMAPLEEKAHKRGRKQLYADRARKAFAEWISGLDGRFVWGRPSS